MSGNENKGGQHDRDIDIHSLRGGLYCRVYQKLPRLDGKMKRTTLQVILVVVALAFMIGPVAYLAGKPSLVRYPCEAAMRQDYAEGTPDSILFQVQMLAHWRWYATNCPGGAR